MSRCAREQERASPVRQSRVCCVLLHMSASMAVKFISRIGRCIWFMFSSLFMLNSAVINPVITALQIYVLACGWCSFILHFIFWGWFSHGFRAARVILLWDRDLPWWAVTWPDLLLFYFLFGLYCSFELFHVNLFSPSQYFLLTGNTVDRIPGATVPSCFSEHGGVGFPLLSN